MASISTAMCVGVADSHIHPRAGETVALMQPTWQAWDALATAAQAAGFKPRLASGYRSFARQLLIWNDKAAGRRHVLDDAGKPIDIAQLAPLAAVCAIMRWSALPGSSRHHWGTDFDVFDESRMPKGYRLALTPEECAPGGVCGDFHQWLDGYLDNPACPFYRPYATDTGGVAPEPWHLSLRATAAQFAAVLTPEVYGTFIASQSIAYKDVILAHLPELFARFVVVD